MVSKQESQAEKVKWEQGRLGQAARAARTLQSSNHGCGRRFSILEKYRLKVHRINPVILHALYTKF